MPKEVSVVQSFTADWNSLLREIGMLEPIGVNRILERYGSGRVVENIFLYECFAGTGDCRRRTDAVAVHDFRR